MSHFTDLPPGPLILDVDGLTLTAEDRELISHPLTGGVVLFARNYDHPSQLTELTRQMRKSRKGPLLISVDQEGGRVQRFREGFTRIPPMRQFGVAWDHDRNQAISDLTGAATLLAWELRLHGVDFSFAPVADLDRGLCPAIGDRSLHDAVDAVTTLATAVIRGFNAAGCASVVKHFPGHGGVDVDPHTDFARDKRSKEEIGDADMQPFVRLHSTATAVMLAHVIFESVDDAPATLSSVWQQDVLRDEIGFEGPIITDDLSMGAITGRMSQADAAVQALGAGSDLALICNDRQAAFEALDHPDIRVGDQSSVKRRLLLCARDVRPPESKMLARASEAIAAYS